MRVLILYLSTNINSKEAGEKLKEYIQNSSNDSHVYMEDILNFIYIVSDKLIIEDDIIKPHNLKHFNNVGNGDEEVYDITETFNLVLYEKVYEPIAYFSPEIIVYTHPLCLKVLEGLRTSGKRDFPEIISYNDFI